MPYALEIWDDCADLVRKCSWFSKCYKFRILPTVATSRFNQEKTMIDRSRWPAMRMFSMTLRFRSKSFMTIASLFHELIWARAKQRHFDRCDAAVAHLFIKLKRAKLHTIWVTTVKFGWIRFVQLGCRPGSCFAHTQIHTQARWRNCVVTSRRKKQLNFGNGFSPMSFTNNV